MTPFVLVLFWRFSWKCLISRISYLDLCCQTKSIFRFRTPNSSQETWERRPNAIGSNFTFQDFGRFASLFRSTFSTNFFDHKIHLFCQKTSQIFSQWWTTTFSIFFSFWMKRSALICKLLICWKTFPKCFSQKILFTNATRADNSARKTPKMAFFGQNQKSKLQISFYYSRLLRQAIEGW